jgi:3-dehydroquinate dehydratase/shikimate dehydrogenase
MMAGQLDPKKLSCLYQFHKIKADTKIFAVTGYPLKTPLSPQFFNTVFGVEQIDAVHIPIPSDSIKSGLHLAEEINLCGFSVLVPYKEQAFSCVNNVSKEAASIGACSIIVRNAEAGWTGHNTDALSFSASLLAFLGRNNFRRLKITIIGAGGSARAIASEVYRMKGKALILNRTVARARALAELYNFAWAGLDSRGANMMEKYSDLIIQASSVGSSSNINADPIDFYKFSGREIVMDIIYMPEKTICLERAERAGCRILGGKEMLLRQLRHHYTYFTGKEFPPSLITRVGI